MEGEAIRRGEEGGHCTDALILYLDPCFRHRAAAKSLLPRLEVVFHLRLGILLGPSQTLPTRSYVQSSGRSRALYFLLLRVSALSPRIEVRQGRHIRLEQHRPSSQCQSCQQAGDLGGSVPCMASVPRATSLCRSWHRCSGSSYPL